MYFRESENVAIEMTLNQGRLVHVCLPSQFPHACHSGLYRSGSASHMLLVRSGENFTEHKPCWPGKGCSPYRAGLCTFSHLFVLNVFNVGHPAEASCVGYIGGTLP